MKIEKEFRDDHQVKLTVEIDSDTFEKAKRKSARQLAKKIKIPGFRPGKAPYGVILRQVGEGHIVEQALDLLIEDQYPEIIKEAEIEPYGPGTLENVPELDPPTFEFVVPLEAEVELGDYKSIDIPYEPPVTSDEDVDQAIESIREQNAMRESVDRPAELGDVVYFRLSARRTDLEESEESFIIEDRFSSSQIESEEDPDEWPFPGFSTELIGLSAEEEKSINHQFPEDHQDEELKGANVAYQVSVSNIQAVTLPEINDHLAQTASEFETLDEWKENLKVNLVERNLEIYAEEFDNSILDHIISNSTIKHPPQMISREEEEVLRGLEYRLSQQGINKELYLQIRGIDEDALLEEIKPVAEDRVKKALVLMEIAKKEKIQADPDQVQEEMGRTVQAISSTMTPNDAKKFAKSEYIPSLASNIVADLLTQKTMDYLRATTKGEPWPPEIHGESDSTIVEGQPETEIDAELTLEKDLATTDDTNEETLNENRTDVESDDEVQEKLNNQEIPDGDDDTTSESE